MKTKHLILEYVYEAGKAVMTIDIWRFIIS